MHWFLMHGVCAARREEDRCVLCVPPEACCRAAPAVQAQGGDIVKAAAAVHAGVMPPLVLVDPLQRSQVLPWPSCSSQRLWLSLPYHLGDMLCFPALTRACMPAPVLQPTSSTACCPKYSWYMPAAWWSPRRMPAAGHAACAGGAAERSAVGGAGQPGGAGGCRGRDRHRRPALRARHRPHLRAAGALLATPS